MTIRRAGPADAPEIRRLAELFDPDARDLRTGEVFDDVFVHVVDDPAWLLVVASE